MAEPKTKPTSQDPAEFLNTIEPASKRADSFALLEMMREITGENAVMWGPSIVGFGTYRSGSGEWPMAAFSPRKQSLTIYAMEGNEDNHHLLDRLGKHTTSKACIYITKLADVDLAILRELIQASYDHTKRTNAA